MYGEEEAVDGNENEGCVTGDERRITMNIYC